MPNYLICFDVKSKFHDYAALAGCLSDFKAARLHNSVWLAELRGNAAEIRDLLANNLHQDDSVTVIQLPDRKDNWDWAATFSKRDGVRWLEDHYFSP